MYRVKINTHPCGNCQRLIDAIPDLQERFPSIEFEVVFEAVPEVQGYPKTAIIYKDNFGIERITATLHGFRTEKQHVDFLASVLEADWVCAIG